jgi:hypothetical protein
MNNVTENVDAGLKNAKEPKNIGKNDIFVFVASSGPLTL